MRETLRKLFFLVLLQVYDKKRPYKFFGVKHVKISRDILWNHGFPSQNFGFGWFWVILEAQISSKSAPKPPETKVLRGKIMILQDISRNFDMTLWDTNFFLWVFMIIKLLETKNEPILRVSRILEARGLIQPVLDPLTRVRDAHLIGRRSSPNESFFMFFYGSTYFSVRSDRCWLEVLKMKYEASHSKSSFCCMNGGPELQIIMI